ncbi:cellulase (glycosyl hydrolase family 5) [Hoeflea marina]|uniref:Cellulase (Glycosyl hydrolase family 5) n=1 Tax=Hoeflea marina TaxID=274592 RepID=A0A317PHY4_9HYPH|nr:glycoside hydrolase family 5 protein [Hoeflea marina]PWV99192.1 cellulase (glycosyl hydrolase family 5) [Hoeflea marina]
MMTNPLARLAIAPLLALCLCIQAAVPASAEDRLCFRGVNLSGAEYGEADGKVGTNYFYPTPTTMAYFAEKGFDTIRLPFKWERLQPTLGGDLDALELERLTISVRSLRDRGFRVILNPHNFGYHGGRRIGSADLPAALFANFWIRLAVHFTDDRDVIFGLMNEPYDIGARDWLDAANAAILGIRRVKAENLILVPGTHWSGAASWGDDYGQGANSEVIKDVIDPGNNFAIEFHQYLDADSSGTHAECSNRDGAEQAIVNATAWLRANKFRGMIGEIGVSSAPDCTAALSRIVEHLRANSDAWLGLTYWAAGDWWPPTEALNIQPNGTGDKPQLTALVSSMGPHLPGAPGCGRD